MDQLDKVISLYTRIGSILEEAKQTSSRIMKEGYISERKHQLQEKLMREANKSLKTALIDFFALYSDIISSYEEEVLTRIKINHLPLSVTPGSGDGEIDRNDTSATLKNIEKLLDRQNIARTLERMNDGEIINLYQNVAEKADRLRSSIIKQVEDETLAYDQAFNLLTMDSNVRIASFIEEEGQSILRDQQSKNLLNRMIGSFMHKRRESQPGSDAIKKIEALHSSVSFMLRDLTSSDMKMKDISSEGFVIELDSSQVDFFLEQVRKYTDVINGNEEIYDFSNDNMSINGPTKE